jgi:hypothetical protein
VAPHSAASAIFSGRKKSQLSSRQSVAERMFLSPRAPAQPSPSAVGKTPKLHRSAMLRITKIHDSHGTALKLEGKLIGPWADELRTACAELAAQNRSLHLDLTDVSYVDRAGAQLLEDLRAAGFDLSACSHFVATVLHRGRQ